MKFAIFILFAFSCHSIVNAQSPGIDSLIVKYTNPQDVNDLIPPSIADTAIQSVKINIHISFLVINYSSLKQLNVLIGKQSGKSDYKNFKLSCIKTGSDYFLTIGNKSFPIVNGKVYIDDTIPVAALKKDLYVTFQPVDSNNQAGNNYSKKLN